MSVNENGLSQEGLEGFLEYGVNSAIKRLERQVKEGEEKSLKEKAKELQGGVGGLGDKRYEVL